LNRAKLWHRVAQWTLIGFLFGPDSSTRAVAHARAAAEAAQRALDDNAVRVDLSLGEEATEARTVLLRAFEAMRTSAAIWNIASATEIDRFADRSAAIAALVRRRAAFDQTGPAAVASEMVLHLPAASGDLRIYPSFLMIGDVPDIRLIDLDDCRIEYAGSDFIEHDSIPADAEQLGEAWHKSNKDGSPDRRFRDNRELPLVRYGHLEFTSGDEILAVYQVSNWRSAQAFANALTDYQWAIAGKARSAV